MAKYELVVAHRSKSFQISELPQGEIPVTLNFDNSNVIGSATVRFDADGNVVADIEVDSDSPILNMMKPALSIVSSGETKRVMGFSIVSENVDPEIKPLGFV